MDQVTEINPADYAKYWWLTLIVGILFVALGAFMFFRSDGTVAFMITVLGIVWLASGCFEIAESLFTHRKKHRLLSLIMGVYSIVLGLCALSENLSFLLGHATFTVGIALATLLMGVVQIVQARRGLRRSLILGIMNGIVGAGLLFFPDSLANILLLFLVGVLVIGGAVLIWYSFWLRRQGELAPVSESVP